MHFVRFTHFIIKESVTFYINLLTRKGFVCLNVCRCAHTVTESVPRWDASSKIAQINITSPVPCSQVMVICLLLPLLSLHTIQAQRLSICVSANSPVASLCAYSDPSSIPVSESFAEPALLFPVSSILSCPNKNKMLK